MAEEGKTMTKAIYSSAALAMVIVFILLIFSIIRTSLFGHVEEEKHIYFEIVFLLLLAVLAEMAVFYLKQQNVTVLMLLGIIMSKSFMDILWSFLLSLNLPFALPPTPPNIIRDESVIAVFAQLGAVILLFKVGLHSKIEKIFSKENVMVATAGVILPFLCGYFYASMSGNGFVYSMFVGATLTATSVGVTVALLKEMGLLGKRFADVIIGSAVIDDVLGLLVLSIVINTTSAEGEVLSNVVATFFTALIFVVGAILTGKYFIQYYDRKEMGARRFLIAIAFMLFFGYVAEVIGLSAIVGAFLAGIVLNRSRHYEALEEKTYGLELIFMPIFFISLGMMVDVNALATHFMAILIITLIAVLTKFLGCGISSLAAGLSLEDAAVVGVGMAPRGEVALIIAAIGLSRGALSSSEYSILATMALLTAFVAPLLLVHLLKKKKEEKKV